jgi:hypothetical protein
MSQLTPIVETLLIPNQNVNTTTVGPNVGLNFIFQAIYNYLKNDILKKFNPLAVGGGIAADNIQIAAVDSSHLNVDCDTVEQSTSLDTAAGSNEFRISINPFAITTKRPNQKIMIAWGGRVIPIVQGPSIDSAESRNVHTIKCSVNGFFTSEAFSNTVTQANPNFRGFTPYGSFFQGLTASKTKVFTIPTAGVYYLRLDSGHSGNFTQTSRVSECFITYALL